MAVGIELHVRGDPILDLDSDAVHFGGGTDDYERLRNLPSLNGVTLRGDLTSEDVGLSAESLGLTPQGVGAAVAEALSEAEMTDEQLERLLAEDD